jgi:transposase
MVNKVRKTDEKRRRFSRDFKLDAINLVKTGGMDAKVVNHNLGLGPQVVERWIKEYEADQAESFPGVGQPKESLKEVYELQRKLKQVEEERDILKKALCIFSREPK